MENILPTPPSAPAQSEGVKPGHPGRKKETTASLLWTPKACARQDSQGPGEQVTITGAWEAAEGGMLPQSPWEGSTWSSQPLCAREAQSARWGLALLDRRVLKMQMLSDRTWVGGEKEQRNCMFSLQKWVLRAAEGQKGWEEGEEGGREGGTHLKPIARNLCSLHLLPPTTPHAAIPSHTPHTPGAVTQVFSRQPDTHQ